MSKEIETDEGMNHSELFQTLLDGYRVRHKAWSDKKYFIYLDDDTGTILDAYNEEFVITINDHRWEIAPEFKMLCENDVRKALDNFVSVELVIEKLFNDE